MAEKIEIPLEDLFDTYTSEQQIKDSYEKRTVPTGRYIFQASKAEATLAGDRSPWPGRKVANFFGKLSEGDKRVRSIGFDASWEVMKQTDKNGKERQDNVSSLWGQTVTALDMKGKPVAEVIGAMRAYPVSLFVVESFQVPSTEHPRGFVYKTAWNAEERKELRSKGYESKNFVRSVSRV